MKKQKKAGRRDGALPFRMSEDLVVIVRDIAQREDRTVRSVMDRIARAGLAAEGINA